MKSKPAAPRKRRIAAKRHGKTDSPDQQSLDLRLGDLPVPIQSFIAKQIDGILTFRKQYPALYDVMFRNIDNTSYRTFESQLEAIQRRKRAG